MTLGVNSSLHPIAAFSGPRRSILPLEWVLNANNISVWVNHVLLGGGAAGVGESVPLHGKKDHVWRVVYDTFDGLVLDSRVDAVIMFIGGLCDQMCNRLLGIFKAVAVRFGVLKVI